MRLGLRRSKRIPRLRKVPGRMANRDSRSFAGREVQHFASLPCLSGMTSYRPLRCLSSLVGRSNSGFLGESGTGPVSVVRACAPAAVDFILQVTGQAYPGIFPIGQFLSIFLFLFLSLNAGTGLHLAAWALTQVRSFASSAPSPKDLSLQAYMVS